MDPNASYIATIIHIIYIMTIQPVKVQPSQIWHVKQCKSKVQSKKTPCPQIKQDHSFTKKSHDHKTEKKVLSKKFCTYYSANPKIS